MDAQNTIVLIIVGLAGLFIGLLISGLFARSDAKARKSNRPTPEMEKEGYLEVARLWYSPTRKSIMPELDGAFIQDHASLTPDRQKKIFRISDLLGEWVRKIPTDVSPQVVKSNESATTAPFTDVPPAEDEVKPLPFIETPQMESLITPSETIPPLAMGTREEKTEDQVTSEEDGEETLETKPKTVAGQISLILEEMLHNSTLKEKGIRLVERADHGVDVWIGTERFDGVESIPYPEAKQLIKAAAARWEKEASLRGKLGLD